MRFEKTALVLEGGGFRGIYSSGVLDYFMEKSLEFPYIIGVSMGAHMCRGSIGIRSIALKRDWHAVPFSRNLTNHFMGKRGADDE